MNRPSLFELNAMTHESPVPDAPLASPGRKLVRKGPNPMALEQRFMFDGAAVGEAVQVLSATTAVSSIPVDAPVADAGPSVALAGDLLHAVNAAADTASTLGTAQAEAERLVANLFVATAADPVLAESMAGASLAVRQFLESASDETLFSLFSGGKSQPDTAWLSRVEGLRAAVRDGTLQLSVVQADGFDQPFAIAAFAPEGPGGSPTIFITRNGFGQLDAPDATRVLTEEFGHAIDHYLNAGSDSAGDEGERFAAKVLGLSVNESAIAAADHGSVLAGGHTYAVEYAVYDFVNAYAMVYDLNNNGAVVGSTGESDAAKEQSSHNFKPTALGPVKVDDYNYNSKYFSGNDVNAIGINIGGQDYYGWISRPIKSNGIVRGMYFWTDTSFTNLQLAQADGNQDGDGTTADNKGFLLVVDQAWFTSKISSTSTTVGTDIDGTAGLRTYANVGSSSDRVDSAINALVDSNVAPVANNDTASGSPSSVLSTGQGNAALEQGYNTNTSSVITAAIVGSGKVLTNDTDSNGDTLSVTTVTSTSTGTSTTATSSGVNLVGKYGTLTIKSDGNWTYTPDNSNPAVNALLTGTLSEAFTYTASDGKGGTASATLTVQINGSNDAPVASNDYNIAKEITTTANTGFTATGNVLTNDSDVDTGDTKAVQGLLIGGSTTVASAVPTSGSTRLIFSGSNGFNSVNTGAEIYVSTNGTFGPTTTYYGLYSYDGTTYNLVNILTKVAVTNGDEITLNATVTHYWNGSAYTAISDVGAFLATNNNVKFLNGTAQTITSNQGKEAIVASTTSTAYSTLSSLSGTSGTVAVGMTVTGPGISQTTKISEITYTGGVLTSIKLDQALTSTTNGNYTFSGTGTLSQALQGAHGSLTLASDGSYTYTPTTDNPSLSVGQSAIEVFDYTMRDAAGVTSSAKLYITVHGSGTNDPNLTSDTGSATESGVSAGSNASGNVLANDTAGTGGTVASYSKADGSGTVNFGNNLTGAYGTLSISSTGAYTYTVNDANTTVDALLPGNTLTETFIYKVTNSAGGISFARLVVTIAGTNDQPVAVADTAAVQEDGTLLATGNVLSNDTDVDSGDTKVVSNAGTSSAGTSVTASTTSANGLSITGTYGTLVLGADGTYSYTLNNAAANVQALAQGATANDVFTYEVKDTNGATHTNTLTITVTGANEAPINQFNGTAISSTASTSVTTAVNTAIDFTGSKLLSVADSDTNLSSITLVVEHGTLSFSATPGVVTLSATSGASIKISAGTQAQLNAALALLRYTPDSNFYGADFLTIMSQDGVSAFDSDGIAINIPTNTTATVSEPALSTGSNSASTAETATGTLTLGSGQSVLTQQTGSFRDGSNNVIGTWQVNTNGTFSVTLTTASSASSSSFSYVVNDSYGNSVNNTVTVNITDDGPTATVNTKSVNEGSTVTGNVLSDGTADTFGADGAKTTTPAGGVVGIRAAGGDTTTAVTTGAGSAITGLYGTLTLSANGSYSYVANSNSVSTAQNDVFVYTVEDGDGTRSTATLTVTVSDVSNDTINVTGQGPVNEGSAYAMFTVVGSGSQTINLSVTNGTATLSSPAIDYSTDGTTWTAYTWNGTSGNRPTGGTVYVRVSITSESDNIYEGSETFSLVATNGSNSAITATGSTSIIDDGTGTKYGPNAPDTSTTGLDDDRPAYSVDNVSVSEGGLMTFTVTRNKDSAASQTVQYATSGGTATSGTDFTAASGTLTFAAGELSKTFTVQSTADAIYEGGETLTVTLSNNSAGSTIAQATGTGTILDDGTGPDPDGPGPLTPDDDRPAFSVGNVSVSEGGLMTFTVTRNK
ncbi:MAG: VCBS domain-containing protein, partial [Polaromonas sp.]|uniref:beta strand repeat-containing protein n=1 Tax=Polaromonas sp. TaxID=1869339 RepID=UPI00248746B6